MATQIAANRISLRGDGPWRGLTTLSKVAPFQFLELENCYPSQDGSELRTFPGYLCVLDPASFVRTWSAATAVAGLQGYVCNHFAARRPVSTATSPYTFETNPSESQIVWTRPTTLHCVEQLNGRWVFVGESDHVREPIFNSPGATFFVKVVSYVGTAGNDTDLTLDANCLTTANLFNTVQANDRIHLEGLTGAAASLLNFNGHNVLSFPAANVIRIDTDIGGPGVSATGQNGYVDRVTNPEVAGGVDPATDDQESLTIWTGLERGSVDITPGTRVFPAHVANRQRDYGDLTGNIKQGNRNAASPAGGRSRRRQKPVPFRLVPHLAGNRLVLVAPGYGCVFQAPGVISPNYDEATVALGIDGVGNDIYDKPRCLGIPKAVMWVEPDKGPGSAHRLTGVAPELAFGGSSVGPPDVTVRNGNYKFKVAYRDEATGEVGLASEPVTLTSDTNAPLIGFRLYVYFPGYLMHESLPFTINLYRTARNGEEFFFDRTVRVTGWASGGGALGLSSKYGLDPETATTMYMYHALVQPEYTADAVLQQRVGSEPVIEQMPMGAKAGRTIRGFTAFGGALGNAGSRREMMRGTLSLHYDGAPGGVPGANLDAINFNSDRVGSAFVADWSVPPGVTASFQGAEEDFGCAARNIPPAYAGQTVVSQSLLPYPRKEIILNKLENTDVGFAGGSPPDYVGRTPDVRYSMLDSPIRPEADMTATGTRNQDAYILLPRSRLQFSEPDHPGVTPATNTTPLANESDFDIEGIGDAGGQFVVCTRDRSYSISFSQTPIGVNPDMVDDKYGCIAANSMVSFEGGCAWISNRGPVAMIGGVQHISAPLERLFIGEGSRYLRQSDGMMRHSWACHDAERNLLYFGVYAGRAGTTVTPSTPNPLTVSYRGLTFNWGDVEFAQDADQIRSRFPCDEVLVYAYKAGVWSVWRPPLNLGIQWMTRGVDAQGNYRVFFLGNDMRLYVLDDSYGNGSKESFQATVTNSGTLTVLNVVHSGVRTWVGLKAVIYKAGTATEPTILRGVTEITAQDTVAGTITLASPVTVLNGDTIVIGARSMSVATTYFNLKDSASARVNKVGIRFQMQSRKSLGIAAGLTQECFAATSVRTEELRSDVWTTYESLLSKEDLASPTDYQWIGRDLANDAVHDVKFDRGSLSGPNHQVKMTFVGGAQVRLLDLYAEAQ